MCISFDRWCPHDSRSGPPGRPARDAISPTARVVRAGARLRSRGYATGEPREAVGEPRGRLAQLGGIEHLAVEPEPGDVHGEPVQLVPARDEHAAPVAVVLD